MGTDLFSFRLGYNEGGNAFYNGNIAVSQWRTQNVDNSLKQYDYTYDPLNRIIAATDNTGNYNLSNVSYDKNGNLLSLDRKGHTNVGATTFGDMDNLTYAYDNGNKLMSVTDAVNTPALMKGEFKDGNKVGNDYVYDPNGNMLSDANKEITSIEYNHLNLPIKITVTGNNAGTIDYVYDATGGKLKKTVSTGTTTEYARGYIYENNILQFFPHTEGYVSVENGNYSYVYQYEDNSGNVRLSYTDANGDGSIDPANEIVEESNYYPFGMEHKGYNDVSYGAKNNLKTYQKQEFTEDLGLNTHEWRYRISDPAIGRFWQIDPLAEDYVYNGTYNFSENRVIDSAELEGLERIHAADGKFVGQIGTDESIRVLNKNADVNAQNLISTANDTSLSKEDRASAVSTLNQNGSYGYESADDAAVSFSQAYHGESQKAGAEIGAVINSVGLTNKDGEKFLGRSTVYILGESVVGEAPAPSKPATVKTSLMLEAGSNKPGELAGFTHTHPFDNERNTQFSTGGGAIIPTDQSVSESYKVPIYLSNNSGQVRKANYSLKYTGHNPDYFDLTSKEGKLIGNFRRR